jgi:hypothetical protein
MGRGYTGGILPYSGRRYYPILAPMPYYGLGGIWNTCSFPGCFARASVSCPSCGRLYCGMHAQTDPHMYGLVTSEFDSDQSQCTGDACVGTPIDDIMKDAVDDVEEEDGVGCTSEAAAFVDKLKRKKAFERKMVGRVRCFVCGTPEPAYECDHCRCHAYCSTACQQKDWDAHHHKICMALAIPLRYQAIPRTTMT